MATDFCPASSSRLQRRQNWFSKRTFQRTSAINYEILAATRTRRKYVEGFPRVCLDTSSRFRYSRQIQNPDREAVPGFPRRDTLRLSLDSRQVGDIAIVRCSGRIVAGSEVESLRQRVHGFTLDCTDVVLHLGDVHFIDSSGLGTLVRLLTSLQKAGGDLKICHVPGTVHNLLKLTNLINLFDVHESEESAVSSFYVRKPHAKRVQSRGPLVLCVDPLLDVLACLREVLHRAGYNVLANSNLPDSLILMRATRPQLVVLGSGLKGSPGVQQAFRAACTAVPVIELGNEFSTQDAGQASSELLDKIRRVLPAGLVS